MGMLPARPLLRSRRAARLGIHGDLRGDLKTTNDCPNPGQGRCYPGSQFLKDQIATNAGLAQEANWNDVTALVGTMADQIVAGIC